MPLYEALLITRNNLEIVIITSPHLNSLLII
jgi:hypothetical protein